MLEVLKQAIDYIENVPDDRDSVGYIDRKALVLSLNQCVKELESQEPLATVTSETGADITMSWWHEPALPIGTKLFTHPPQRTWVGLTNEERLKLYREFEDCLESDGWEYEKAIEARLKELNT